MKRFFLIMLCFGIGSIANAGENCVKKEKNYYGSKYFNKCHCETFSYPDVEESMKSLGINAEPRWVVCSTFDGDEWCVCGVRLSWMERPEEPEECEARKTEVKALADKFLEEKKDFGVSAPLICR